MNFGAAVRQAILDSSKTYASTLISNGIWGAELERALNAYPFIIDAKVRDTDVTISIVTTQPTSLSFQRPLGAIDDDLPDDSSINIDPPATSK